MIQADGPIPRIGPPAQPRSISRAFASRLRFDVGSSPRCQRDHGERTRIVIGFILYLLIIGIVAGFIARAIVPGPDPMGVAGTIVLGIIGSFIGGFLGWALFGKDFDQGAL